MIKLNSFGIFFHCFGLTVLCISLFAVMNNAINTSGILIYFDLLFQQHRAYVLCADINRRLLSGESVPIFGDRPAASPYLVLVKTRQREHSETQWDREREREGNGMRRP